VRSDVRSRRGAGSLSDDCLILIVDRLRDRDRPSRLFQPGPQQRARDGDRHPGAGIGRIRHPGGLLRHWRHGSMIRTTTTSHWRLFVPTPVLVPSRHGYRNTGRAGGVGHGSSPERIPDPNDAVAVDFAGDINPSRRCPMSTAVSIDSPRKVVHRPPESGGAWWWNGASKMCLVSTPHPRSVHAVRASPGKISGRGSDHDRIRDVIRIMGALKHTDLPGLYPIVTDPSSPVRTAAFQRGSSVTPPLTPRSRNRPVPRENYFAAPPPEDIPIPSATGPARF